LAVGQDEVDGGKFRCCDATGIGFRRVEGSVTAGEVVNAEIESLLVVNES